MARPTGDQLRALAAVLPPNERLHGSEVADVLSAVVAFITHGDPLVAAAEQGVTAVQDFFHDVAVARAAAAGQNAPQRLSAGVAAPTIQSAADTAVQVAQIGNAVAQLAEQLNATVQAVQALQTPAQGSAAGAAEVAPVAPAPAEPAAPTTAAQDSVF